MCPRLNQKASEACCEHSNIYMNPQNVNMCYVLVAMHSHSGWHRYSDALADR